MREPAEMPQHIPALCYRASSIAENKSDSVANGESVNIKQTFISGFEI